MTPDVTNRTLALPSTCPDFYDALVETRNTTAATLAFGTIDVGQPAGRILLAMASRWRGRLSLVFGVPRAGRTRRSHPARARTEHTP